MSTAAPRRKRRRLNNVMTTIDDVSDDRSDRLTGHAHDANLFAIDRSGDSGAAQMEGGSIAVREYTPSLRSSDADETLAILLPLLILLSTLLCLLLLFLVFLLFVRRKRGIVLPEDEGPLDLGREEDLDRDGGFNGVEHRWLESAEEGVKTGYMRAKNWQAQYPPNSQPTDITLSQFLSIQEKGVSAWSFEPDYESNPPLIVQSRTEIIFLADGVGMAPEEGGGACVQSNLPLPRLNEVYYWECKMYEKPETTTVAVGLATKPYPSFRLPGWNRYSAGYLSSDGFKSHNYPFTAQSYGPPLTEGDVIGIGFRPRTGAIFFTRNGKKLDEAYVGFSRHNVFPTVGANGAATVHVNLGQAGFVFIEANVKKWGLAPSTGTLAPPPAYGSERGSILLATAAAQLGTPAEPSTPRRRREHHDASLPSAPSPLRGWGRRSRTHSQQTRSPGGSSVSDPLDGAAIDDDGVEADDAMPHNPPTPNLVDISLRSLSSRRTDESDSLLSVEAGPSRPLISPPTMEEATRHKSRRRPKQHPSYADHPPRTPSPDPPEYHPIDQNVYAPGVAEAMLGDSFGQVSGSAPTSTYEGRQLQDGSPAAMVLTTSQDSQGERPVGWREWLGLGGGSRRIALPTRDSATHRV